jgi:hypothetical protein
LLSTRGTSTGSIEEYFRAEQAPIIAEFGRQKAAAAALAAAAAAAAKKKAAAPPPPPPPPSPPPPPKPTTPRPDDFFETFAVPITVDQKIIRLAWEIANIEYRKFPVSAAMLTRALLDEILREHLGRVGKDADYRKTAGARAGLKSMILYASETKNGCFKDMQIAAQLARFQNSAVKDDLDNVVHNRYGSISKEALLAIKPYVRPILEAIIQKEWI